MENIFNFRKQNKKNPFIPPNGWLGSDNNSNEWAVAFHGCKDSSGNSLGKIIVEGFLAGDR